MSHVEVILSFVIFLGFLIFIFSFINPFQITEDKNVYLNLLERGIKENVSVEVFFLPLKIENEKECFSIYYEDGFENAIKVKNEQGLVESYKEKSWKFHVNGSGTFFYVLSSKEFEDRGYLECDKLEKNNYTLGLWRNYKLVSNKSLWNLKKEYEENYENLKEYFRLPSSKDFLFEVKIENKNILNMSNINLKKGNVYSRNLPIEIVYKDGVIKTGTLNMRIW